MLALNNCLAREAFVRAGSMAHESSVAKPIVRMSRASDMKAIASFGRGCSSQSAAI